MPVLVPHVSNGLGFGLGRNRRVEGLGLREGWFGRRLGHGWIDGRERIRRHGITGRQVDEELGWES
jgi:hypothetical protein